MQSNPKTAQDNVKNCLNINTKPFFEQMNKSVLSDNTHLANNGESQFNLNLVQQFKSFKSPSSKSKVAKMKDYAQTVRERNLGSKSGQSSKQRLRQGKSMNTICQFMTPKASQQQDFKKLMPHIKSSTPKQQGILQKNAINKLTKNQNKQNTKGLELKKKMKIGSFAEKKQKVIGKGFQNNQQLGEIKSSKIYFSRNKASTQNIKQCLKDNPNVDWMLSQHSSLQKDHFKQCEQNIKPPLFDVNQISKYFVSQKKNQQNSINQISKIQKITFQSLVYEIQIKPDTKQTNSNKLSGIIGTSNSINEIMFKKENISLKKELNNLRKQLNQVKTQLQASRQQMQQMKSARQQKKSINEEQEKLLLIQNPLDKVVEKLQSQMKLRDISQIMIEKFNQLQQQVFVLRKCKNCLQLKVQATQRKLMEELDVLKKKHSKEVANWREKVAKLRADNACLKFKDQSIQMEISIDQDDA